MIDRSAVSHNLDRIYGDILLHQEKFSRIQNWCLTVWLGTLIAPPQLQLGGFRRLLLPITAVLMFWLLAAFEVMQLELAKDRAIRLERLLADNNLESATQEDVALIWGSPDDARRKWAALGRAMFKRETVLLFFGLLFLASLAFFFLVP